MSDLTTDQSAREPEAEDGVIDAVIDEAPPAQEGSEQSESIVDAIVEAITDQAEAAASGASGDVVQDDIVDAVDAPAGKETSPPAQRQEDDPTPAKRPKQRIVALIAAGSPVPLAFARLVDALRSAGADVTPLSVPPKKPRTDADRPPRLSDLKAGLTSLAESLLSGGDSDRDKEHWLISQLRAVQGKVDAVVTVDPNVAAQVFPLVDQVWSRAVRVAVDADYTIDPEWRKVPFDDLVVAHPSLGTDLRRIRERTGRLRTGGPIVGGETVEAKRLSEDKAQVVASFASMPASDVDSLLFQLSLARPERFHLLFLPSGRDGIDELVRTRAGGYGLRGKRPKAGKSTEGWIRGASVVVGRPSPGEAAAAVQAGVPMLIYATDHLNSGEQFLKDHNVVEHSEVPLTISVQLESLLPDGHRREAVVEALGELRTEGVSAAATAVLDASEAGRPSPYAPPASTDSAAASEPAGPHDDELEDIGVEAPPSTAPTSMSRDLRKAYLSEIILHEKKIKRQLLRAKEGHITWTNRARLAANAGDDDLARRAIERVEGLERIVQRLDTQLAELNGLRDRFAGRDQLTEADRHAAAKFMSPDVAATLDRAGSLDPAAFTKLELNEALQNLKDKLRGS